MYMYNSIKNKFNKIKASHLCLHLPVSTGS
ncbi:MAG: hypothetical protein A8274_824 [Halanaerobium sp. 4-GBenrich]|nr:MAG: hypothetical protein A8274_824 [Halanaerobium sp. 4-GBenrich]